MHDLIDTLPPLERLAASYAPAATRPLWIGYFALEQRLADTARDGRDPIMVQLRLAWWRDRLGEDSAKWPKGEPLLAALGPWNPERAALVALVDGIEALHVGEKGPAERDVARVGIMAALARFSGGAGGDAVERAAREWTGLEPAPGSAPRLPRAMRPLVLLRGLALRGEGGSPFLRFLTALRLGLLGR
jgi:phytoene synthase